MKILFLSRWFPFPTNNGSKLRIFNLLRGLARHHEIILISFTESPNHDLFPPELLSICSEIQTVPLQTFNPSSLKARLGWLSLTPRSIVDTFSEEMAGKINKTINAHRPDLIIASQLDTAIYFKSFEKVPAIFEEVENSFLYERYSKSPSYRNRLRYGLTWWKHRRLLRNLLNEFMACTVVSEEEKELLISMKPEINEIEVIPNCVNINDYSDNYEPPKPKTLIFSGSLNFYPNYEAMVWFVNQVFPLIEAQIPDIELYITGDHGNRFLTHKSNIIMTGYVIDIKSFIANSWLSIVPIMSGGGTRLKILEAMSLRTPIVTTTKGAEGLRVKNGVNIMIGDTPIEFASQIIRLVNEPGIRNEIAMNAYHFVRNNYDWSIVLPKFLALIEKIFSSSSNNQ